MRKLWLIFAQAVTVIVAGLFVLRAVAPSWLAPRVTVVRETAAPLHAAAPWVAAPAAAVSFAAAAQRAMPAVVAVTSTRPPTARQRRLFGDTVPTVGLGSGVIVSADGYVLTNDHVVDGASRIVVKLADHREARARIVGLDPDTDLAVLHIDLDHLPTLAFADDGHARVGDVVLAIGYPFGVGQTVTQGIVSALGRNELGINTYENFIQTDAAINPGNSGGALVDMRGQLLGINTAIFSRSGGSLGIGFAIPASTARNVMQQLIATGHVLRGWIGVAPRDLSSREATALHLDEGVRINAVLRGGPAARAGLHAGDVVLAIDGRRVRDTGDLLNAVAALRPHAQATLRVLRDGSTRELQLTVGLRPASADRDRGGPGGHS